MEIKLNSAGKYLENFQNQSVLNNEVSQYTAET